MFKTILALLLVASVSRYGWAVPLEEPSEMLARAEALYYEAEFGKSIELLLRADEMLRQSGNVREKTDVKLQLALGYIGLNDTAKAKAYLSDLYALDPDRHIDPQMFPPKVIRLADEVKAEQDELRCKSLVDEAQKQLAAANSDALLKLIGSNKVKCSGLATVYPKASDMVFKEGLEAYKKTQMTEAVQKFRAALALEPKNDLAAQYLDLTQSKLEVNAERTLFAWRKDFAAGDFALAARDYRELVVTSSAQTVEEVRAEYRKSLTSLVEAWNRACANLDSATMEQVRIRVNALLPEPTFGADLVAAMKSCTHTGCVQMDAQLALARLKTRVEPQFTATGLSQVRVFPVTVRVKARINENGSITNSEMQGGNPLLYGSIRTALEQWKFLPAIINGMGARCIDTEFPIVINKN